MPLRVTRRKDTGALEITGTVAGRRIRQRPQSDSEKLAAEEAALLEASLLRSAWHGERPGVRTFAEALASYLKAETRAPGDVARLRRILPVIGRRPLSAIGQEAIDDVAAAILRPGAAPATIRRGVIVPIRAVMRHAHRRRWCEAPDFEVPREPKGRTRYLLPDEAERLVAAAAPHLGPLLVFLLSTGARLAEAIEVTWRDVDLAGGRVILWRTKGGGRRDAALPPAAVLALGALAHREGPVFLWQPRVARDRPDSVRTKPRPYVDRERQGGGQIRSAWKGALARAGLDPGLTPHDLRHTWASWHYALHRDLLALKTEGAWSSVTLVERYAHLMPVGHEQAIRRFWHGPVTAAADTRITA